MGLISTLYVGTRALFASQMGMNVAGQNISNADVEGYSRKRITATPDYRRDPMFGQVGLGVQVLNIQRMRDALIDQQIRRQNQEVGFYKEIDYALERVENILTEPSDTGLLFYMDEFFNSWHNLANNPEDLASRTMVKTSAEMLTGVFHNVSGELRDLRQGFNERINLLVEKINKIATDIYNMNREIGAVEVGAQNANDSRDRRDELLKQLAQITDINVIENELGQVTVTTGGNILVSPVGIRKLEMATSVTFAQDGTTVSNATIRYADSKREYSPLSGSLKALFEARDRIIPEYEQRLDTLARTLVEKVNDMHRSGYSLRGYSGLDFFDSRVTGASDIGLSASILSDVQNIAAAQGGRTMQATRNNFGPGAFMFGMTAQPLSKTGALPALGTDVARNIVNGSTVVRATIAGTTTVLRQGTDYHIDPINGTIQLLHAGFDGAQFEIDFQYQTGVFSGPGDNANAVAIAKLRETLTMQPDPLGNSTNTFTQYYSALIGKVGLNRTEATSNYETRTFLIDQYQAHQDSIAGVSLDEEMADLIKFQHTYQAAARLISVTSQMLDVLMNM